MGLDVGDTLFFPNANGATYEITIVQGSENFISVAVMVSITTEMTAADIITESEMTLSAAMTTRMTNAATPTTMAITIAGISTTMIMTILARTITTIMTAFLTTTMTIGAAIDNSHLPPSFPPSSFPPSSPIMVSYGLAKNGDSWIPAAVIPATAKQRRE